MDQFVTVVENDQSVPVELPCEDDGSLLLSTLTAQFPSACGLQYKASSGALRGTRLVDGKFSAPDGFWGDRCYYLVGSKVDNKRKNDEGLENPISKTKKLEKKKCSDLIVLGLPWDASEDELRSYFSQFGELKLVQIKTDIQTGKSKGFGFICFTDYDSQIKCLAQRHMIGERWCDVRVPNSKLNQKDGLTSQQLNNQNNRKVFVGRITEEMTDEDIRGYFSKYGAVLDVFIPKPFRSFAFVTFSDADLASSLCGEDHVIGSTTVHVRAAAPKNAKFDTKQSMNGSGSGMSNGGGMNSGFGGFSSQWGNNANSSSNSNVGGSSGSSSNMGSNPNQMGNNPLNMLSSAFQLNPAMVAAAQAALAQAAGQAGGWANLLGAMTQNQGDGTSQQGFSAVQSNPNTHGSYQQQQQQPQGASWNNQPHDTSSSSSNWNNQQSKSMWKQDY